MGDTLRCGLDASGPVERASWPPGLQFHQGAEPVQGRGVKAAKTSAGSARHRSSAGPGLLLEAIVRPESIVRPVPCWKPSLMAAGKMPRYI